MVGLNACICERGCGVAQIGLQLKSIYSTCLSFKCLIALIDGYLSLALVLIMLLRLSPGLQLPQL